MTSIYIKNQGNYEAVYSFEDDTIGSAPTGWTLTGASTPTVQDNFQKHRYVVNGNRSGGGGCTLNITQADKLSGVVEGWVAAPDCTSNTAMIALDKDDATDVVWAGIDDDFITYYDGAVYQHIVACSDNTWYHISIRWRATGGDALASPDDDLVEGKFRVYVNTTKYGDYNLINDTDVDRIWMYGILNGSNVVYWDAIGWDWDAGYDIGDNYTAPNTDITAKTKSFMINYPMKRTPTANGEIFNQALEYDDIIKITGNRTSYLNSKIDQNGEIYKGTYNFRDDTIRSAATDWTVTVAAGTDAYVIDKYNEHSRVLQVEDLSAVNATTVTHTMSPVDQTYGTIEYNIATTDPTFTSLLYIKGNGSNMFAIGIDADVWKYLDDGGFQILAGPDAPVAGQWYHIRIDFECTLGAYQGLSQYDYHFYIDDVEYGDYNFAVNEAHSDQLQIYANPGDNGYLSFWDAFGFSWDTSYTIADNKNLEVTLTSQTLFEGRVIEEASEYVKDIKLDSLSIEGEEIQPGEEGIPYEPDGYASTANFTEEVIVQTINVKCSTITAPLIDEIYRGTYSFENDTNAAVPMGILDDSAGAGTLEVLTASLGSHKNYIHIDHADADHGAFKIFFEAQTTGVVEWIVRTTDVATGMTEMNFYDSGAVVKIKLVIRGSKHKWYDGVALTVGSAAATNTWYSYRLSFDCTTDTFSLWVDGNLEADGADFFAVSADIGQLRGEAVHDIGNPSFDSYFDAIGLSWDKFYTEASDPTDLNTYQNSHIYIPNVEVGGQTVDFSLQGEFPIERLASTVADLDVNIWKYSPDHAWLYDSGTLSNSISLTKYCKDVTGTDFLERYNTIITKGGWNAGSRVYGSGSDGDAQTTYGIKTITRLYTALDESSTPLNTIAASILALQGNTPKIVTLEFRNTTYGMFAVGETITVPASTILYRGNNAYLDAGNWLISSIRYDCIRDVNIMRLVNTLFFEYNYSLIEELETLANG